MRKCGHANCEPLSVTSNTPHARLLADLALRITRTTLRRRDRRWAGRRLVAIDYWAKTEQSECGGRVEDARWGSGRGGRPECLYDGRASHVRSVRPYRHNGPRDER